MNRRQFLKSGGILAAAALAPAIPWSQLAQAAPGRPSAHDITSGIPSDEVFPQSVASGDPTPTGVILWTRIAPEAIRSGVDVALQVAVDPSFRVPLLKSILPESQLAAAHAHTVRIDLDGLLQPGRTYHYRFIYDGTASRTGRCRTLPDPKKPLRSLKFAVASCQNLQNGHFTALGHIAREEVDFLLHLGDFIYEYAGEASYNGKTFPGRGLRLPSGAARMQDRADLDHTWATYRSDPHLQRALERHTLIATWDDHEIANDRYYDAAAKRHYGDKGFALNEDAAACDAFFRDGAQAWFDWMPARIQVERDAADPAQVIRLHRSFRFGDLVELFLLDERWHRSKQLGELTSPNGENVALTQSERTSPDRTLLGKEQLAWFTAGLESSPATWKAVGNGVQLAPLGALLPGTNVYVNLDAWDGYEADRQAVVASMAKTSNVVVLTGDLHTFLAGYVQKEPGAWPEPEGNRVAVEFMAGGVTSAGIGEIVEQYTRKPTSPGDDELFENVVLAGNPHLTLFNSHRHGYSVVEFTPAYTRLSCHIVDKTNPLVEGSGKLLSVHEVPRDRVELQERFRASPSGMPLEALGIPRASDPRRGGLAPVPPGAQVARSLHDLPAAFERAAAEPPVLAERPATSPPRRKTPLLQLG